MKVVGLLNAGSVTTAIIIQLCIIGHAPRACTVEVFPINWFWFKTGRKARKPPKAAQTPNTACSNGTAISRGTVNECKWRFWHILTIFGRVSNHSRDNPNILLKGIRQRACQLREHQAEKTPANRTLKLWNGKKGETPLGHPTPSWPLPKCDPPCSEKPLACLAFDKLGWFSMSKPGMRS